MPMDNERNGKFAHLVDHCIKLHDDIKASTYRKKKIAEIEESIRAYEQEPEADVYKPWSKASDIVLPLTTITVDNLEPRLVSGITGRKPFVRMAEEAGEEQDQEAVVVEAWYNGELEDVVKVEHISRDVIHTILKEGTYFCLPGYEEDEVIRKDFAFDEAGNPKIDDDGAPILEETPDAVFQGATVTPIPFSDVFIPDDADDWETAPVGYKKYPTYAELMRLKDEEGYQNIDEDLLKTKTDQSPSPAQEIDGIKVSKDVIECIEFSLNYIYQEEDENEEDITDFSEERIVACIALESRTLIYLRLLRDVNFKNQHLLRRVRLFPERGKAYGSPIYAKLKSVQKGASRTYNQGINSGDIAMVPWFLYGSRAGLKSDTEIYPGCGVKVDDPTDVVFPKFNFSAREFIEFITIWVQFWERIANIGDLQVGRPNPGDQTATETLAVIQEGNVKHQYQSQTFKDEFLGILRGVYDQYYMYAPMVIEFTYRGQPFQITRKMMQRPQNFRLTGSTNVANKMIERKENEDLFRIGRGDGLFNPIQLVEDLLVSYGRTKTQKYINPQIAQIVQTLIEIPEAGQLFEQAMQEAQELAQTIQAEGQAKADLEKKAMENIVGE